MIINSSFSVKIRGSSVCLGKSIKWMLKNDSIGKIMMKEIITLSYKDELPVVKTSNKTLLL